MQRNQVNMSVAIDFGTTTTSAAYLLDGEKVPTLIKGRDNSVYWQSTIYFKSKDDVEFGIEPSKDPTKVIYDNKRFFGRYYEDVESIVNNYPWKIIRREKDGGILYILKDSKGNKFTVTPQQVATMLLRHIHQTYIAPVIMDRDVNYVLTVPGYFTPNQRRAMKVAGLYIILSSY